MYAFSHSPNPYLTFDIQISCTEPSTAIESGEGVKLEVAITRYESVCSNKKAINQIRIDIADIRSEQSKAVQQRQRSPKRVGEGQIARGSS